jgi:hypothetical protein
MTRSVKAMGGGFGIDAYTTAGIEVSPRRAALTRQSNESSIRNARLWPLALFRCRAAAVSL